MSQPAVPFRGGKPCPTLQLASSPPRRAYSAAIATKRPPSAPPLMFTPRLVPRLRHNSSRTADSISGGDRDGDTAGRGRAGTACPSDTRTRLSSGPTLSASLARKALGRAVGTVLDAASADLRRAEDWQERCTAERRERIPLVYTQIGNRPEKVQNDRPVRLKNTTGRIGDRD